MSHFNAGLRIYDVSHARLPREVASFVPPEPSRHHGPMPEGELVAQTEDVLVERRGYIYVTDKNQGLWILRYTRACSGCVIRLGDVMTALTARAFGSRAAV